MRGSKASELIVLQPRPSLAIVIVTNLCRLLGRCLFAAAHHPATVAALVLGLVIWRSAGPVGLLAASVAVIVGLLVWRRLHADSFLRVMVSRWRAFWVYRRCWQPAMHTCHL